MATVNTVLEIQTRSLHQYHPLTHFPVRIGRALDNDIILSDPTISAYHLEIQQDSDGLLLRNLSTENGSRLDNQPLSEQRVIMGKPLNLLLGSRPMRLLRSDMDMGSVTLLRCKGLFKLFCNPLWSIALVALMVLAFAYESYLQTMFAKEMVYYLSNVMPYVLGMIALTILVTGISRLSAQRWEVGAAISLSALFMLIPHLLGELGHALNYFFTADWPLDYLLFISNFLLLPALLYMYIRLVHYTEAWPALGIALLFSAPLLVYQASDVADQWALANEFTGEAKFSRTLSAWDIRLQPTLSVDEYFADVQANLKGGVE